MEDSMSTSCPELKGPDEFGVFVGKCATKWFERLQSIIDDWDAQAGPPPSAETLRSAHQIIANLESDITPWLVTPKWGGGIEIHYAVDIRRVVVILENCGGMLLNRYIGDDLDFTLEWNDQDETDLAYRVAGTAEFLRDGHTEIEPNF